MSTAKSAPLVAALARARARLGGLARLLGEGGADAAWYDEVHDQLLLADVGAAAADQLIADLRQVARRGTGGRGESMDTLRRAVTEQLQRCEQPPPQAPGGPLVLLMTGVNGSGKTTTVAKLAAHMQRAGRSVMLAACDTYRAAAIEQLQTWGRRLQVPVIAQARGTDSAAVAHDAYHAARARGVEVLLVDTAGRQHTAGDLMAQLQKVVRVLGKGDCAAPHEIMLTVDASGGQNILSQVAHFQQAVGVHGLCITKLDGSAKGGIALALARRFALPIRYLGVGEGVEDLREFRAAEFAAALLPPAPQD